MLPSHIYSTAETSERIVLRVDEITKHLCLNGMVVDHNPQGRSYDIEAAYWKGTPVNPKGQEQSTQSGVLDVEKFLHRAAAASHIW